MSGHRMDEIISLFAALPYFKNMDAQTTQAVAQAAIRRDYEPDQIILLEGEPAPGEVVDPAVRFTFCAVLPEGALIGSETVVVRLDGWRDRSSQGATHRGQP